MRTTPAAAQDKRTPYFFFFFFLFFFFNLDFIVDWRRLGQTKLFNCGHFFGGLSGRKGGGSMLWQMHGQKCKCAAYQLKASFVPQTHSHTHLWLLCVCVCVYLLVARRFCTSWNSSALFWLRPFHQSKVREIKNVCLIGSWGTRSNAFADNPARRKPIKSSNIYIYICIYSTYSYTVLHISSSD